MDDEVIRVVKQRQLATAQCIDALVGLRPSEQIMVLNTVGVFFALAKTVVLGER